MLVSYNQLQTFFSDPLPHVNDLADLLTLHTWEIDDIIRKPEFNDVVLDVKVLPDKSSWAFSHRGIAREIATLLNQPLKTDAVLDLNIHYPQRDAETIVEAKICDRYLLAKIEGVTVQESPEWMRIFLASLGQRSINNIVDATNFILFIYGQPTHVFDAEKVSNIRVRQARDNEAITLLGGNTINLSDKDTVIVDSHADTPLAIGGVKGGNYAELTTTTTTILLESAHFESVATRKTAQRLKLRTDASVRYENGILADMATIGLRECIQLITQLAGGTCVWYEEVTHTQPTIPQPMTITREKIDGVLGITIADDIIESILSRAGCTLQKNADSWIVTPPFWRTDLIIPESIASEIARIHGLEHIYAEVPQHDRLITVNKQFFYTEKIRHTLVDLGFSEIYTSSFRSNDRVALRNAFASDKGFLRSALRANMDEVLAKNIPWCDVLGVREIRAFEMGKIFTEQNEILSLCIGVRGPAGYKSKAHDNILKEALRVIHNILGETPIEHSDGIMELHLNEIIEKLPEPSSYDAPQATRAMIFVPFSSFPAITRDIAFWTDGTVSQDFARDVLRTHAGEHLLRIDCVDTFTKENRVSLAFRMVFQSREKTLTDEEVNASMEYVYRVAQEHGWETR